jgi:hypothetical protein
MKNTTCIAVLAFVLLACGGKEKARTFEVLDKHASEYGACRVMSEQKTVDGEAGWIAASVCDVKHRQAVLKELPDVDAKKFDGYFTDWKKEKGAAAVAAARKNPLPSNGVAGGGMSESARIGMINDCNLVACKGVGGSYSTPAHQACVESCCRSRGMKVNCRE